MIWTDATSFSSTLGFGSSGSFVQIIILRCFCHIHFVLLCMISVLINGILSLIVLLITILLQWLFYWCPQRSEAALDGILSILFQWILNWWHHITLKQSKSEMLPTENIFASHVLLLTVENSNLRKLIAWIQIACAQFTIFVVAPAVQIPILVCYMSKLFANRKFTKVQVGLLIDFFFKLLNSIFIPDIDFVWSV